MNYYLEFGGGLGDVFQQLYNRGAYNLLRDMRPGDRATVVLICANPFARELFDLHPKADQIEVKDLGYWDSKDDAGNRERHGLPAASARPSYECKEASIEFPATAGDLELIAEAGDSGSFLVLAASAGLPDRNLPEEILERVVEMVKREGWRMVATGRTFERHGRWEVGEGRWKIGGGNVTSLIDRLTVPGTARLVQECAGLVTCHSALNILGWLEKRPQLLLYPQSVAETHVARRDQWAFGIDWPITTHGRFEDFEESMVRRFLGTVTRRD